MTGEKGSICSLTLAEYQPLRSSAASKSMRQPGSVGHWMMQFAGLVQTFNLICKLSEKATMVQMDQPENRDGLCAFSDLPAVGGH